ncbi:MAG: alcohol dehydrogenase catalytic domain-containing protein [Actinobacteria bacterium]|nr:alcohol dehydrogenase catalytic domain-containing protein [Actinomycetota bacterium]
MRGLVLEAVGCVRFRDDLADPVVEAPTDAVVAVTQAGLCGSDLHPYEGREAVRFGVVPGHEAVGRIVSVGDDVSDLTVGARVVVPFTTSCSRCEPCRRRLTARCANGALFGFGSPHDASAPPLHGGQAQLVRVPWADGTLVEVPDDVDDRSAVLLTDNLPTAWCAVRRADLTPGDAVVVVGLGAVGLCAVAAARWGGAGTVLAVDPVAARRERAVRLGAVAAAPAAALQRLAEVCGSGQAAPAVIEAAGTPTAQALAFSMVRPGGTLSVIAVQTAEQFGFTPVEAYDANITMRFGRASVRAAMDQLLAPAGATSPLAGDALRSLAEVVITDPDVPLADGPAVYDRFARRTGGIVKAVFTP